MQTRVCGSGTLPVVLAAVVAGALLLAGCGGDDIAAVAKRQGLDGPWGVAVYTDINYVDNYPGTGGGAEAENLTAIYSLSPEPVLNFEGTTADAFSKAVAYRRVLVMPELEMGDLNTALDPAARPVIANFVSGGGILIATYPDSWMLNLLNGIFGLALTTGSGSGPYTLQPAAAGTVYAGGAASLPYLSATWALNDASLPAGSQVIYADPGTLDAAVAVVPFGAGRIVILGWDWFDAPPLGFATGAEGWLSVLAHASQP